MIRFVPIVAAGAAALVTIAPVRSAPAGEMRRRPAAVVEPWKTIEYRGVRVAVPAAWERVDNARCAFTFPRWAPPQSPPCDVGRGVTFSLSAVFCPAHGPGLRAGSGAWGGYEFAGDYAVFARDTDRVRVRKMLDSARAT